MVPEAAERARVPLERATGLSGVTERLASTIGPAVGGLLVAALGALTGLVVNAVCFALGSLIISLALPRDMGRPAGGAAPSASGYWRLFREGFAFLRGEPLLLTIIVMVGITNLLDAAFGAVLLPVWAERSGNGPTAIGLSNGTWSAAAVAGSLAAAAVAHRMPRRVVFFTGFLLAGAPRFLALAGGAPMWAVLAVFAVGGAGAGFLNPILGAIAFERVPPHLRGRVNALGDSLAWAGIPLGGLAAGAAVVAFGLGPALLISGAAYFLTTNLAALLPQWREMDRLRGRGAREPAAEPQPAGAGGTEIRPGEGPG